eukprot:CAMPEP_0181315662 /NCGR_PEP_ID=MMETSP1101-20121128/15494_1 /TAXON_ID=46948 /ORGANISM="Rhodomonas abbreviata, Strain Caron Lab Isolate" /LENGTH=181 /DNA_ID=CAMNT_0023422883 /DNA_START=57 /DNA_END=599 /DNA_ORIENTATION=-
MTTHPLLLPTPPMQMDRPHMGPGSVVPPEANHVKLLCSLLHASSQLNAGMNSSSTYEQVAAQGVPAETSKKWPSSSAIQPTSSKATSAVNKVFPRRKAGQDSRTNNQPVVLSETLLQELFCLPLQEACAKLGICATALKKACRKLGIKKWPYRNSRSTPSPTEQPAPSGNDIMLFKATHEW